MKSRFHVLAVLCCLVVSALITGCATQASYDYTAFKQSRPRSILILPPVNNSNAVEASNSVLSQMTLPLAESGYYVMPVTLVDETFRQNGYNNPAEITQIPFTKLHQIFGADAALYVEIKQYGTTYKVISSDSVVSADARLVDLRTGAMLWQGTASASNNESGGAGAGGGGIIGILIAAVVNQVIQSTTDASHRVAGVTSARLLAAGRPAGLLYGPRSPNYQRE